jgi:FixJ family two-component response regulator
MTKPARSTPSVNSSASLASSFSTPSPLRTRSIWQKNIPGASTFFLSDVVMPGLRGPDLHRQILELQPKIKVLFMSAYAEGLPDMKLPPGAAFLQKPFRFSALLEGLRQLQSGD